MLVPNLRPHKKCAHICLTRPPEKLYVRLVLLLSTTKTGDNGDNNTVCVRQHSERERSWCESIRKAWITAGIIQPNTTQTKTEP